jgi:putative nucleotidyltransferase with HDIG domain
VSADSIEAILPEVFLIKDEELRRAVIEIWEETLRESNWTDLEDVPKNAELPGTRKLAVHTRSVTQMALACATVIQERHEISFDQDKLIAAAILHDVSKLLENEPQEGNVDARKSQFGRLIQHGEFGAHKAWDKHLDIEIVHNILAHTRASRVMPSTWEAIIVHYVDYLDSDALLFTHGKKLLLTK